MSEDPVIYGDKGKNAQLTIALNAVFISFVEHVSSKDCEWIFFPKEKLWRKDGHRNRSTEELFHYFLICLNRGQKGC